LPRRKKEILLSTIGAPSAVEGCRAAGLPLDAASTAHRIMTAMAAGSMGCS
jgi:hypothetical protein